MGEEAQLLGVTELLAELLGNGDARADEEVRGVAPFAPPQRVADGADVADGTDGGGTRGTSRQASICEDGGEQPEAEHRRQLAELRGEVDRCLASLDDWREDQKRDRDALLRDLERQYGFSYEADGPCTRADAAATAALDEPESLAAWCAEVENVLGDFGLSRAAAEACSVGSAGGCGGASAGDGAVGGCGDAAAAATQRRRLVNDADDTLAAVEAMELELARMRVQADAVQVHLDDARDRVDCELDDLEAMLLECDVMREGISAS